VSGILRRRSKGSTKSPTFGTTFLGTNAFLLAYAWRMALLRGRGVRVSGMVFCSRRNRLLGVSGARRFTSNDRLPDCIAGRRQITLAIQGGHTISSGKTDVEASAQALCLCEADPLGISDPTHA